MGSSGWVHLQAYYWFPLTKAFHCNCTARWNAYNQKEGSIFNCWDNRRPSRNFSSVRTVLQKDPVTSSLPSSTQNCHSSSPPQDDLWLLPHFWIRSDVYFTNLIPCKTTSFAVISLLTCRTHLTRKHSVIFFLSLAALSHGQDSWQDSESHMKWNEIWPQHPLLLFQITAASNTFNL